MTSSIYKISAWFILWGMCLIQMCEVVAQACDPVLIDCPQDITMTAGPGECDVMVSYTLMTTGSCGLISMSQIDGSGLTSNSAFPIGSTMQTYVTLDDADNRDTCTFIVHILPYPAPINSTACNNEVTVYSSDGCEVLITPDMVLEGGPYACYEIYDVVIMTGSGNAVPNPVTYQYFGDQLQVQIFDPYGNSCWGYLTVYDGVAPIIYCGFYPINCRNNTDPSTLPSDSIPFPVYGAAVMTTSNPQVFILPDYEACGDVTLSYSDQIEEVDCTLGGAYTRIIYRHWTAIDQSGNQSVCIDTIALRTPGPNDGHFINRDGVEAPRLLCSGSWDINGDGIPQPDEIGDKANAACDIWAQYEDEIHGADNCVTQIHRRWTVLNKCTGIEQHYTQLIQIEDDVAPTILCPDTLVANTNQPNCRSNFHVPEPLILDGCSQTTYTVESSTGNITNIGSYEYPHYVINDLEIGSFVLTYTAVDACGNSRSCNVDVYVEDRNPPDIQCENVVTVYLGTSQDHVNAAELVYWHYDECGIAAIKLRRLHQGICNTESDDLIWHDVETFCCEEAGQLIGMEVGVWDIHGNMSVCAVGVLVSDQIVSKLICPPDITVSCNYNIDLNDLSVFGEIAINDAPRRDIIIDDPTWVTECKGQNYHGPFKWGIDGKAMSQCPIEITQVATYNNGCSIEEANIIRTFYIWKEGQLVDSCQQLISIANCGAEEQVIIWPGDKTLEYCVDELPSIEITGQPALEPFGCRPVFFRYKDIRTEYPVTNDTCYTVRREWEAVDTCMGTEEIKDTHTQWLVVIDVSDLVFECPPDSISNITMMGCKRSVTNPCYYLVNIPEPLIETCDTTPNLEVIVNINYRDSLSDTVWVIDYFKDGMPSEWPVGSHKIAYYPQVGCGEAKYSCAITVVVEPCDTPELVCPDSIYTIEMDSTGVVVYPVDVLPEDNVYCDYLHYYFLECTTTQTSDGDTIICIARDSLLFDCSSMDGSYDTVSYTVVVENNLGDADTCGGSIVLIDTNEMCIEPLCEYIYGITNSGTFYSINTSTGEINTIGSSGIVTATNAVAVNPDLGLGYFGSIRRVYWIDLRDGTTGVVGDVNVFGLLTNAAASYLNGHLYLGPETTGQMIEDLYRVKLTPDGKGFEGDAVNISDGALPLGNFGDFIVLDGDVGSERFILSIFNNFNANLIIEYRANAPTYDLLHTIPSNNSSQITLDNQGNIWYFNNATNFLGKLNLETGEVYDAVRVNITFSDLGRAWCPPSELVSANRDYDTFENHAIRSYPNPFVGETTLEFYSNHFERGTLQVWTTQGALMDEWHTDVQHGWNTILIDQLNQPGTYILKIFLSDRVYTHKLIMSY